MYKLWFYFLFEIVGIEIKQTNNGLNVDSCASNPQ